MNVYGTLLVFLFTTINARANISIENFFTAIEQGQRQSADISFEVSQKTKSFVVQMQLNDYTMHPLVGRLIDPNGRVFVSPRDPNNSLNRSVTLNPGFNALLVPSTDNPSATLAPGKWTLNIYTSEKNLNPSKVKVRVRLVNNRYPKINRGKVKVNLFFSGSELLLSKPGFELTAESAQDPTFAYSNPKWSFHGVWRSVKKGFLNQGILLEEKYLNLPGREYAHISEKNIQGMVKAASALSPDFRDSINIFFIDRLPGTWDDIGAGYVSLGIPGFSYQKGSVGSSILISTHREEMFRAGSSIAHEIGHFLGLSHLVDSSGDDQLSDTREGDVENVMFFAPVPNGRRLFSPQQVKLMKRHPLVKPLD